MAIDKEQKEKIRLYYETHLISPKETAKVFNVNYRTLMIWIKKEKWEQGKALEKAASKNIKQNILKAEFGSILHLNKEQIKQNMKENLSPKDYENINLDEILDGLSDDILFKILNVEFLHKEMMKSALIAKEELLRMRLLRKEGQINPVIIASAEKYNNILSSIQKNLYDDRILSKALNNPLEKELENLSNDQLLKIINENEN